MISIARCSYIFLFASPFIQPVWSISVFLDKRDDESSDKKLSLRRGSDEQNSEEDGVPLDWPASPSYRPRPLRSEVSGLSSTF
jgi:hypothetical protein